MRKVAPAACTIISRNYLSYARVLAASYLEHHPGARFYLLVVDELPDGFDGGESVQVVSPDELDLPFFSDLCFKYDVTELCTAVKPSFLSTLLNRYGEKEIVYLDPDILVMRRFDELIDCLPNAQIVLTPHLLTPIPQDGLRPTEQHILMSGAYNLGFIAVRQCPTTQEFLSWWQMRLKEGCFVDVSQGLMTDQKWVDLVPGLFGATIFKDDTYNVAYWNIHSRMPERKGDQYLINGRPLTFFHFSGFNPAKPAIFSKYQNRTEILKGTALSDLLDLYVQLHMDNGFDTSRTWTYRYDFFDNRVKLSLPMRRAYWKLSERDRLAFGNPFITVHEKSFLEWATKPTSTRDQYSPFLRAVYDLRPDVAAAYPDIRGRDREEFLQWVCTSGAQEFGYDPADMRILQCELAQATRPVHDGPKCSVIIPVHNKASLTHQCLENVFATVPCDMECEIVVVDDGSSDNTTEVLKTYKDRVRVVAHDRNEGFAVSCNDGAVAAKGEYLIFLNNDTIPQHGWLDKLVTYADAHSEAAAVGSKLLFPNQTVQHCGIAISEGGEPRHLYTGFPENHPSVNRSRKVKAVTGACILIRRADFHTVNGFDTGFRNGYEDVDLCLRLGDLGREVHYCHESVLYHFESATRDAKSENEVHNRKLYRSRWADRIPPDELNHYVADELLKIEYAPLYPIQFSISPMLGTIGERAQQADRIIQARTRQVFGLLKDNIRLNIRVQEAEHRGQLFGSGRHSAARAVPAIEEPRVIHKGGIQWLSNHATGCVVSIILPVKNGANKLRELLPAIAAQQTRDHIELVAVDSGSTDESMELLRAANATLISIDPRAFNHGLTRNLATTYASGSIFIFLNQSTLPADEHWLANLIRPFTQHPTLAGVYGRVLPRPDADMLTARETKANINAATERVIAKITDWSLYRSMAPHDLRRFVNFHTMSAAIRADVFRRIPFRETDFAEDLIWGKEALEAGLQIQFEPSSVAFHSHNYSLLDILRRNFDDGIACRKIVGLAMSDEQVGPHMREIRDTWRYLEKECGLTGEELELWRLNAAVRRTALVFGQWLGLNFHRVNGDLAALLSITEQIKAGAKTEVNDEKRAHARFAG